MKKDYQIVLTDEDGIETPFEFVGICEYKHQEYMILLPDDGTSIGKATVMLIEGEGENECYYPVEDHFEEQRIVAAFKAQQMGVECSEDDDVVILQGSMMYRPMHGWKWWTLLLFRIVMPAISLMVLRPYIMRVYIAPLNWFLPPSSIAVLLHLVHVIAIILGGDLKHWRGWRYEVSMALLPTEISLLFFFAQHHFGIAVGLCIGWILGAILLFVFRESLSFAFVKCGSLMKDFVLDLAATTGGTDYLKYFFKIAVRRYMAIAAAVLMLVPAIMICCVYGLNSVGHVEAVQEESYYLDKGETLAELFAAEQWATLSADDKIAALQLVADIEAGRMQIDPVLVLPMINQDKLLGKHLLESRFVFIDLDQEYHQIPIQCIETLLHECRHVYQSDCVNSLDWSDPEVQTGPYYREARLWKNELLDYQKSDETEAGYDAYYNQYIEADAREYAWEAIGLYRKILGI